MAISYGERNAMSRGLVANGGRASPDGSGASLNGGGSSLNGSGPDVTKYGGMGSSIWVYGSGNRHRNGRPFARRPTVRACRARAKVQVMRSPVSVD